MFWKPTKKHEEDRALLMFKPIGSKSFV